MDIQNIDKFGRIHIHYKINESETESDYIYYSDVVTVLPSTTIVGLDPKKDKITVKKI